MKILLTYVATSPQSEINHDAMRLTAPIDIQVKTLNLALAGKHKRAEWPLLNNLWKSKNKELIALYNNLITAAADCDILINLGGWNLHPELLKQLNTYNIYSFNDDPESSEKQSKHIAPHFDAILYSNIASGTQYKAWGCKNTAWFPIPLMHSLDQTIQKSKIIKSYQNTRTNDTILCCDYNAWRTNRLNKIGEAFPNGKYFGHRWNSGWIKDNELIKLYLNTKIGWNIHNSTGPINHRMFTLPAFGILQICDNKYGFGEIFKLNEEAIGFNTIDEAIDLTHHYLKNPDEAQKIAIAGYERYQKNYTPQAVWQTLLKQIKQWTSVEKTKQYGTPNIISTTPIQNLISPVAFKTRKLIQKLYTAINSDKWQFDDSIYLNCPTNQPIDFTKEIANTNANPKDPIHQEAIHRAITHLIDNAKIVTLRDDNSPALKDLLSTDPQLQINTQNTPDLYIDANPISITDDSNHLDAVLTHAKDSTRLILNIYCTTSSENYIKELKEKYKNIRHYTLKDPYVPLLSPIAPNAKAEHRIVHCY